MTDDKGNAAGARPRPYFCVGNKNARNIYMINPLNPGVGDIHIGVMFQPEYGPLVVTALNSIAAAALDNFFGQQGDQP